MRLPQNVIIAGRTWKVVHDKDISGGRFDSKPGIIKIGSLQSKDEETQVFIHEVLEAILAMKNHRYENYQDENYMFVFNHRDFLNICRDLTLALKGILKSGG